MAIRVAAVVVAAGRGTRTGLDYPKQYKVMGGSPMVRESLRVFTTHPQIHVVLPVIHPDDGARFAAAAQGLEDVFDRVGEGGGGFADGGHALGLQLILVEFRVLDREARLHANSGEQAELVG